MCFGLPLVAVKILHTRMRTAFDFQALFFNVRFAWFCLQGFLMSGFHGLVSSVCFVIFGFP